MYKEKTIIFRGIQCMQKFATMWYISKGIWKVLDLWTMFVWYCKGKV